MRIDLLMNKLCLVKTRSIAKKACDNNAVRVNGKTAKASLEIKPNDIIEYDLFGYNTELKIIKIPIGNVAKKDAPEYYEISRRELVIKD
ncbi:MAG: S4 domain-containing protein [Candidatus Cloacimonadales bacterium]|jgi:ribosome-associated heat shock protein Hsp15|nr:RNA-binding protein [Candidatus Cloacimonadota bacterium]MDD2650575.1 S4 domain-containing protein [Candidatus Cloacimonadota bacterium]MDD3501071.1 S4 domain-containing protein [Candidatus Cloacimonadota bacterium]MDX9977861.1 S4 domain-containing protein [Candidatus Cloacimonadales bacterium]